MVSTNHFLFKTKRGLSTQDSFKHKAKKERLRSSLPLVEFLEISMKEMIANKIRGPDFGPLIFWA